MARPSRTATSLGRARSAVRGQMVLDGAQLFEANQKLAELLGACVRMSPAEGRGSKKRSTRVVCARSFVRCLHSIAAP